MFISQQLLEFLLNYRFSGNVGNLKNTIQLTCANAFSSLSEEKELLIQMYHLPQWINFNELKKTREKESSDFICLSDLERTNEIFDMNELIEYLYNKWEKCENQNQLFFEYDKFFRQKNVDLQFNKEISTPTTYQEVRFR